MPELYRRCSNSWTYSFMSESTFQSQVTRWMRDTGWYVYFTPDSRRSPSGYPDLTATKDGYLLFNELKRGPKDGTSGESNPCPLGVA